jgi:dephospho-CoA kinase
MSICVGITGGIGSGKSTVCQVFRLLGAPVFEADQVARQLTDHHPEIIAGLIHLFGKDIYRAEVGVDRKKLADIIFNNEFYLEMINQLVHPVVRNEFRKWADKQEAPYVIHEAAILFETGFYKMMDFTILISAPENQRIERVVKRNGINTLQVKERMDKQWSDEKKRLLASYEIINDNQQLIIPQIIQIDKNLKEYGKIW